MEFLNKYFNYEKDSVTYGLTNELIAFYVLNLFKNDNDNILIVTSTLYEANKLYSSIRSYSEECDLFPMDDFLASVALAVSPEFKMTRLETLEKLQLGKRIVITNLTGYLKYLPSKNAPKSVVLIKNEEIKRNELIEKLDYLGYHRESLVTSTGEYALRGFIVDIYPFNSDKPLRLEFFGNELESIKYFDEETQLTLNEISEIRIDTVTEIDTKEKNSLYDYMNNPKVLYLNKDQIDVSYQKLCEDIINYNESNNAHDSYMYEFNEINVKYPLYIDNINRLDDLNIEKITPFKENFELLKEKYFKWSKENKKVLFYLDNDKQVKIIKELIPDANIINEHLNEGFIIGEYVVLSPNDIGSTTTEKINYKINIKLGKKVKNYNDLEKGDYVVHLAHGIGVYNGIVTLSKFGLVKDYIQILYEGNDKIYIPVEKINTIYKYGGKEGYKPKINKLNSSSWLKTKSYVKSKAKDISRQLLMLYKKRASLRGEAYKNHELIDVFASDFPYNPTRDQLKAIDEISKDLGSTTPMDRLLCGDVGFGKTEVANRAMFKTILNNRQVMYLCPTTILANQQYNVIKKRFQNEAVEIRLLNRFTTAKEKNEILKKLKDGTIDIIVGTHRLLSNDVELKKLGLLVVDEEQRFGVSHKEKIKSMKEDVNVLTLSATPIPRTLKMALSGLRDMSVIETPPVNRYPVQTYVIKENDLLIKDAIYKELSRNGQIFVLYNRVQTIEGLKSRLNRLVPEAKIVIAHGQMGKDELENVMEAFIKHEADILLCTTIIENGIDIANANTLLVFDADNFGLSQLYQIRGRVGRSNKIAYAYLFYSANKILNETAVKRLQAIKEFTELGSGYKIAMRDLAIRGSGDIFGSDQAGFVDSVGISLYLKLIEDEIKKAKGEEVEEEEEENSLIEVSTHIKDNYVNDEDIKILIHQKINEIDSYQKLIDVKNELENRFGKIDKDLDIYMHSEWFSNKAKSLGIKNIKQTDRMIEINLPSELSDKIRGDKLLIDTMQISTKFNIKYFNKQIIISFYPKGLEKHYIYYLVSLMEKIKENIIDATESMQKDS